MKKNDYLNFRKTLKKYLKLFQLSNAHQNINNSNLKAHSIQKSLQRISISGDLDFTDDNLLLTIIN